MYTCLKALRQTALLTLFDNLYDRDGDSTNDGSAWYAHRSDLPALWIHVSQALAVCELYLPLTEADTKTHTIRHVFHSLIMNGECFPPAQTRLALCNFGQKQAKNSEKRNKRL